VAVPVLVREWNFYCNSLRSGAVGLGGIVEWLDGGMDHGEGFDHCDGPIMADLADGGDGWTDQLSSG